MRYLVFGLCCLFATTFAVNMSTLSGDAKCTAANGKCANTDTKDCNGEWKSKLCSGGNNRRCCVGELKPKVDQSNSNNAGTSASTSTSETTSTSTSSSLRPTASQTTHNGDKQLRIAIEKIALDKCNYTRNWPARATLPAFEKLTRVYPNGRSEDVKKKLGGRVNANWVTNTCAIRMSYTLIKSGATTIPRFSDWDVRLKTCVDQTIGDKEGNRLVFRVAELEPFIRETFGEPSFTGKGLDMSDNTFDSLTEEQVDETQVGLVDIKKTLKKHKGVIRFNIRFWNDATGHLDLWDGDQMVEPDHSPETDRYIRMANKIEIWDAK